MTSLMVVFEENGEPGVALGPFDAVDVTDVEIRANDKTIAAWAAAWSDDDEIDHGWAVPTPDGEYGLYPKAKIGAVAA